MAVTCATSRARAGVWREASARRRERKVGRVHCVAKQVERVDFVPYDASDASWTSGSFDEERRTFAQRFRLRSYEVDGERMASIITLANMLQEVATNHVLGLWGKGKDGFPVPPEMVERNLGWVMARMKFQLDRYPTWGDLIEVRTWFCAAGKLAARRDWDLVDIVTGERIGGCTSMWVCLDMAKRRMSRIPPGVRQEFEKSSPVDEVFALGQGVIPLKLPDFDDEPEFIGPTVVARRTDIDMNGHVNNVAYIGWALEALPLSESEQFNLKEVEIEFKNEALQGERVVTMASPSPCAVPAHPNDGKDYTSHCYLHSLSREADGEELVLLRSHWCPK
uniref:Acyl-[acyl-carrier-protein] hydrolase n=1 Tax=Picocystis salinarum TaxID=88271 RepID=A0A7S3XE52_9CHLO